MSFKAFAQRTNPIKTTRIKSNNPWEFGQKVQLRKMSFLHEESDYGIGTIVTFEIARAHWGPSITSLYGPETVWVSWPNGHAGLKPLPSRRTELTPVA